MYRIVSPTAILGYGFPEESLRKALEGKVDLIAVDAGSMDAGPFYLGARSQYVGESALKRDLEMMIKGALEKKCRLIIGSTGFSGGDTQLFKTVEWIKAIVVELAPVKLRLAVIPSGVSSRAICDSGIELIPLGEMPELTERAVLESEIVGQMGIEPIITAIKEDAQIIVCGRAYDPAVFAADAIHRGYPEGICLHAAKILECGAIACEPGSGSDCLIAEITEEGEARFYPANEERAATIKSVAAHTLYEKSRPDIFYLPGGFLSLQKTRFTQVNERVASLAGSKFYREPYSIKLEGSRSLGKRIVSIIPLIGSKGVDRSLRVYGRNGVESTVAEAPFEEMGMVVIARGNDRRVVKDALAFIRSTLLHFGYKGRISTAGNLAFPFSPSDFSFDLDDGTYASLFVAGTRDPIFQKEFNSIKKSVVEALREQHLRLFQNTVIEFMIGNSSRPIAILETIAPTVAAGRESHAKKESALGHLIDEERISFCGIDGESAYTWSIHHLVKDMDFIKKLFPIQITDYENSSWKEGPTSAAEYGDPTIEDYRLSLNKYSIETLRDSAVEGPETVPLQKIARVIRSKNAGINEITFDVLFDSESHYAAALRYNQFGQNAIAQTLNVDPSEIIGCFRFDPACAIKITLRRRMLCGDPGERDVFGAQQHSKLLTIRI